IADAIRPIRRNVGGIFLDAEEELAAGQNGSNRHFNARLKISSAPRVLVELQRSPKILASDGPAIGTAGQRRDDGGGTTVFFGRIGRFRGPAHKQAAAARRVADSGRVEGASNRNRKDGRLNPGMTIHIEM